MALIDDIITVLRQPEDRRLQASVDQLVARHMEVSGSQVPGFLYRGLPYRHSTASGRLAYAALDPSLYAKVEAHLASKRQVENDLQLMQQALVAVLRPCASEQDYRDAMPECLIHAVVPDMAKLPRERPEAYTLEPGSRAERQYLKALPKIEYLTTARLLF